MWRCKAGFLGSTAPERTSLVNSEDVVLKAWGRCGRVENSLPSPQVVSLGSEFGTEVRTRTAVGSLWLGGVGGTFRH